MISDIRHTELQLTLCDGFVVISNSEFVCTTNHHIIKFILQVNSLAVEKSVHGLIKQMFIDSALMLLHLFSSFTSIICVHVLCAIASIL